MIENRRPFDKWRATYDGSFELVRMAVAEMRASGLNDHAIASILFSEAAALCRDAFPDEQTRWLVITNAAGTP